MARQRRYRAISLFTGAGGLDIGLERSGRFEIVACSELEDVFCDSLEANVAAGRLGTKNSQIYRGSIEDLDPVQVMSDCGLVPGELDLLVGGPPCQTFSTAGRRGTLQDPRGMLLWQFLRFVEVLRPKFFLMENVRGLLSAAINHRPIAKRPDKGGAPLKKDEQPGSVVDLWVGDLASQTHADYRVDCFEVNAANYGAPQIRERVLFIGNRFGRRVDFPEPTHFNPYGSDQASLLDEGKPPFRTLGDALDSLDDPGGEIMDFSPRKKSFLDQVPEGSNWRSLPSEVQKESMGRAWSAKGGRSGWWRRLSRDLPSPTVVTMPNHASTSMCHPTETRALTLRECAAIQEFPEDWEFCGTTSQKYAQVGNAVPIRLGQVAGQTLGAELDAGEDKQSDPDLPLFRRVYINSHIRTRKWFKGGEVFVWKDGQTNKAAHYSAKGAA